MNVVHDLLYKWQIEVDVLLWSPITVIDISGLTKINMITAVIDKLM